VFRTGSDNEIGKNETATPREWRAPSEVSLVSNFIDLFSPSPLQAFCDSQRGLPIAYRALEV
jgi:hypothetical protein